MEMVQLWTKDEEYQIGQMLAMIVSFQKSYGAKADESDLLRWFKLKLGTRYRGHRVLAALERYTDTEKTIPTVAEIIEIMGIEDKPMSYEYSKMVYDYAEENGKSMTGPMRERYFDLWKHHKEVYYAKTT